MSACHPCRRTNICTSVRACVHKSTGVCIHRGRARGNLFESVRKLKSCRSVCWCTRKLSSNVLIRLKKSQKKKEEARIGRRESIRMPRLRPSGSSMRENFSKRSRSTAMGSHRWLKKNNYCFRALKVCFFFLSIVVATF